MVKRRVVVTGLGMVTPLGIGVSENWQNILQSKSGITHIDGFAVDDISTKIAGIVPECDLTSLLSPKESKKLDKFIHFALLSASEALTDSGLELTQYDPFRIGVALGSGIGGIESIQANSQKMLERGANRVSPFFIPGSIINMASGYVSIHYGLQGPNFSIATACTTGSHNIGFAARSIAYGDADVMLAGGAEHAATRLGLAGFASLRALSTRNDDPAAASRPWDKDRDGFVLGEGAGVLVLEEYEHAKKRDATIYAELTGFGMSADAAHLTMNDQTGIAPAKCMQAALKDAGLNTEQIDYINAHATSTPVGDPAEVKAIKHCFQGHATTLAVSSTKSMTGHLLGAAGAIEAIYSITALQEQILPPTINLDCPDEGCDLDFVPNIARDAKLTHVLSNSFAFGGTNASVIFSRV